MDQLCKGQRRTNQEWALVSVIKPYHVRSIATDNRLEGEEAAIRQLMYDFYFTLPLYPEGIEMNWPPLQIEAVTQTNT